jgi:hypothetical protein
MIRVEGKAMCAAYNRRSHLAKLVGHGRMYTLAGHHGDIMGRERLIMVCIKDLR